MMVKEERRGGVRGVTRVPLSVKGKSWCGMNTLVYSLARLFSAQWVYGYWKGVAASLLPRRSQYFSLSFVSLAQAVFL